MGESADLKIAERPTSLDYISDFERYMSLHGDRYFGDKAIVGGLASIGRPVTVVGQQKDAHQKENIKRNFGDTITRRIQKNP